MKKLAIIGALLAAGTLLAAPAEARTVCLTPHLIDHTTVVSPRTILFHMKDGMIWRSDMRTPCLGLRFYGFSYVSRADEICGGSQAIQVIKTHEVCVLGPFERERIGRG